MTDDVAAAGRGLLSAGADEVVVLDNHGSGNPENVIGAEPPHGARLETWNVFDLAELGGDAMLQVGYHARAGVPAFISHTYNPELRLRVNGELISESHGPGRPGSPSWASPAIRLTRRGWPVLVMCPIWWCRRPIRHTAPVPVRISNPAGAP